jgi:hypothetical protein
MYEDYHDIATNKLMYKKVTMFCTYFYVNEVVIYFSLTTYTHA